MALAEEIQLRTTTLASQRSAGLGDDDMVDIQQSQVSALLAVIARSCLTPQQTTDASKAIAEGPWTPDQRRALLTAVAKRLGATTDAPTKGQRRASQTHDYLEYYVSPELVDALGRADADENDSLDLFTDWMWKMGLVCGSEETLARAAIIFHLIRFKKAALVVTTLCMRVTLHA